MIQAIYSARVGMQSQQSKMDTIAMNVANVNTTGFKGTRLDFKDAIYQTMLNPEGNKPEEGLELGHGTLVGSTNKIFVQGSLETTERGLDFALVGEGFFAARNGNGETLYTRNGQFGISVEEAGNYLVTSEGYYVLAADGEPITVPDGALNLSVSAEGSIMIDEAPTGRSLAIYDFANREALLAVGQTYFVPTENSGDAEAVAGGTDIRQGIIERSNVDLNEEVTEMIKTQRAIQLISRAITTSDTMEGTANALRG
ncbi:flagellar hook-basal body protein [Oscillospiraceae bacterium OttesenSCG-928-F05]|nr:flagellar hook-basal body protein [Oscillospiraceae bacterium OttesenSCG-928-F05]